MFSLSHFLASITCIAVYHVHQSDNRLSSVFPSLSDSPLSLPVFPCATLSTRAPRPTAKLSGSLTSPPILDISTLDFRPASNLIAGWSRHPASQIDLWARKTTGALTGSPVVRKGVFRRGDSDNLWLCCQIFEFLVLLVLVYVRLAVPFYI
jgi:hypothetical protein